MSRQFKMEWRQKLGYCTTCDERPVLLFNIKRHRLNPLWQNKQARTVAGECDKGVCLRCQKERLHQSTARSPVLTAVVSRSTSGSNHNATNHRQTSNSTLGSNATPSDFRSTVSAESLRYTSHQSSRPGTLPLRSKSNDDVIMAAATSAHHNSHQQSSNHNSRLLPSGNNRRVPHRAALRGGDSHHHTYHQPSTIDELNQSGSEMHVPAFVRPMKRMSSLRQMSSSNFSAASSISLDVSVPSLEEEHMSDLNVASSSSGHNNHYVTDDESKGNFTSLSGQNQTTHPLVSNDEIMDQLRDLLGDLHGNPAMAADVLLNAMKQNAERESIQVFLLESLQGHVPAAHVEGSVSDFLGSLCILYFVGSLS